MAPDLNSLPPSRSPTNSPLHIRVRNSNTELHRHQTPSPRSSSISLAAAASVNAGLQNQESRRSSISSNHNRGSPQIGRLERRISNTVASLSLNDPTLPGPGELQGDHRSRRTSTSMGRPFRGDSHDDMTTSRPGGESQRSDHGTNPAFGHSWQTTSPSMIGGSHAIATGDPHHSRQQSLGELHQELEQEQEAQVNRLLQLIRQQQAQLLALQHSTGYTPSASSTALNDIPTPSSEHSMSFATAPIPISHNRPHSPRPRGSHEQLSRHSSRRSQRTDSRIGSPAMPPRSGSSYGHGDDWLLSGGTSAGARDDAAFYQAETQMLARENQMLRHRIRELEQQARAPTLQSPSIPATPSNLGVQPGQSAGSAVESTSGGGEDKV